MHGVMKGIDVGPLRPRVRKFKHGIAPENVGFGLSTKLLRLRRFLMRATH